MTHAKVAGVPLEQAYLLFAEQERLAPGLFFQPQQPLVAMREIVPEPDPAYACGTYVDSLETQFVCDALRPPGRAIKAQGQYLFLYLRATRFGCGPLGPRFFSTRAATPPT